MAEPLQGVTSEHRRELDAMLRRLSGLWSELTSASAQRNEGLVDAVNREIAACRSRLEEIKRAGTKGSA